MTMFLRTTLLFLLTFSLSPSTNGLEGRKLSKEEHLEIKKQLKLINKPAVKTIKTRSGDAYNCINFYKQAAFDHPLLKNHSFHYKMGQSSSKESRPRDSSITQKLRQLWVNGKGCPEGTVPIRKVTKNDLIRAKLSSDIKSSKYKPMSDVLPGLHHAVYRTKIGSDKKYQEASMVTSLYNPHVESSQFSASHMKLHDGYESIEVGWIVNPSLYGDNSTRLFIYTNAGNSHCFGTQCPGFIYTSAEWPLDYKYENISVPGTRPVEAKYFIQRDVMNIAWYLKTGSNDEITLGFWPSRIFNGGKFQAQWVHWGGEVYSPPNVPSPPMGSGRPDLYLHSDYTAYVSNIQVMDEAAKLYETVSGETFADIRTYHVKSQGNVKRYWNHLVFYTGQGGYVGN